MYVSDMDLIKNVYMWMILQDVCKRHGTPPKTYICGLYIKICIVYQKLLTILIFQYITEHITKIMTCDFGNPGPVLGQPQAAGGATPVNGIYSSTNTQQQSISYLCTYVSEDKNIPHTCIYI
jgi:hypothetical protein